MKTFNPPLKVGGKVRWLNSGHVLIVDQLAINNILAMAHGIEDITESHLIFPSAENEKWIRFKPLAPGDEVVLIQRRSGIVREVSGETAIVDTDNKGGFYIILTAKEDETWERAK